MSRYSETKGARPFFFGFVAETFDPGENRDDRCSEGETSEVTEPAAFSWVKSSGLGLS